ncbi:MAG TPA: HPr family phosphocarrier protein [Planctomycetota bacterium]|nr:HPr family phosphocarrier protein [Planctomycetota bacterium]
MTTARSMIAERQITIQNTLGLHVRPSAELASTAAKFQSRISVIKDGQTVNAKSSIDLLTLAAVAGSQLTLRAEGEDATQALAALASLIEGKFGEE